MNNSSEILIPIAASTLFMMALVGLVIYFMILYRKKQRGFQLERENFKQAVLQTEIEIKEQTLGNISRELHDNVGQIASLIKMNLSRLTQKMDDADRIEIEDTLGLLTKMIVDIKELSVSLKGENLNRFGLVKMIKQDIKRYEKGHLNVKFSCKSDQVNLSIEEQIFVYRMSQEIFNNILKHAQASTVEVYIKSEENRFELMISDNGLGFDLEHKNAGSGLINLQDRCDIIGANLLIKSVPGYGVQTNIILDKNG